MALADSRCQDWVDDWQPARVTQNAGRTQIELNGGFPRDCTRRAHLQLIDRQELAEKLFRTLWRGLGGTWDGSAVEAAAPAGTRVLARHDSRPWGWFGSRGRRTRSPRPSSAGSSVGSSSGPGARRAT